MKRYDEDLHVWYYYPDILNDFDRLEKWSKWKEELRIEYINDKKNDPVLRRQFFEALNSVNCIYFRLYNRLINDCNLSKEEARERLAPFDR